KPGKKCEHLEKELSKSRTMSKSFEALQKHAINLELNLQQCKENIKMTNLSKKISQTELKKLIENLKGKSVETKFEKSSVIRQPNAFKSQRQSILGKPVTTQNVSNDFSKPVTAQILPQNMLPIVKNTNVIVLGMYKVHTKPNQTRTPQLHQDIRKPNKRVSFSTGVIPTTSVSRPQPKSNQLEDKVSKKCVLNENHDLCVLHYINGVNSRTSQPMAVPISTREPKQNVNQSVATSSKKTVATDSTVKKYRNITRKIGQFGYDNMAPFIGFRVMVTGTITIKRVYYVEGHNHNLFSVGQFCDADLEVAFRKSTCYIRDLKGNDLLTGSRGTDLYSISLKDSTTPNPICLMAKATSSQEWLWLRRNSFKLRHINLL
ncbi:hypothetical protein Tco_0632792, partial [Tanacetum coccineum]